MKPTTELLPRAREAILRCQAVARFSEDPPRITRTFLSPPMRACHEEIGGWMRASGMQVHIDAAGNLRGVYPAANGTSPKLLLGSHLDTVPDAGAYDGVLGVVLAVSLIEALAGHRLPFALEVVGFSEEEGVRFGVPFIGSRALAGTIDEELLSRRDPRGITVRDAIFDYGLDANDIPAASLDDGVLGFLEFHIEQGPVLEGLDCPLGVVEAIAGQTRMDLVFTGAANHAGTTPMTHRRDALVAAAEWAVAVEKAARDTSGLVATVGVLEAKPGASNVVAGKCRTTLDARHASDAVRAKAVSHFLATATEIAQAARHRIDVPLHSRSSCHADGPVSGFTNRDRHLVCGLDAAPHRQRGRPRRDGPRPKGTCGDGLSSLSWRNQPQPRGNRARGGCGKGH